LHRILSQISKEIDCSSFVVRLLLSVHFQHFLLFGAATNSTIEMNKVGCTCHQSVYVS
jgi:hypothetical protein